MWHCVQCSLECSDSIPPAVCPRCFKVETYTRPVTYQVPKSAMQIPNIEIPRIRTGEPDIDALLFGGFAEGARYMLWGRGGTGKSRLAMRWGTGTCNALYISLEMDEIIAANTARTCGANMNRLFFTESHDNIGRKARECGARIVILDSLSEIESKQERLDLQDRLTSWVRKTSGVVVTIVHENKHGQHAGSHKIQHWGDAEIKLKHGTGGAVIVEVKKSRFSPVGRAKTTLGETSTDSESQSDSQNEDNQEQPKLRRLRPL
jgi:predicted ATP-dependent serine protease